MPLPAHEEMQGSPTENHDGFVFTAQRKLKCAWADRYALISGILSTGPDQDYPHRPNWGSIARGASIVPFNAQQLGSGSLTAYEFALVTINYGSPRDTDLTIIDGGKAVSMSLEPNVEFMTLDHEDFRWDNDQGDPLNASEAPGRRIEGMSLEYTIFNLISLPIAILDLVETSNGSPLNASLLGLTFPEETLLFSSPTIERRTNGSGVIEITAKFSFAYRKNGWNKHWRVDKPGGPGWSVMYTKRNGIIPGIEYKNFPPTDWAAIL